MASNTYSFRWLKSVYLILVLTLLFCLTPLSAEAKAKAPTLSKTSVTLKVGKKTKFTVKGKNIVSVRCKSTASKIAVVKGTGKTRTIVAKKKGACKIKVVVTYKKTAKSKKTRKKTLYLKVKVKKATTVIEVNPDIPDTPIVIGGEDEVKKEDEAVKLNANFAEQTADFAVSLFKTASAAKIAKGKNTLLSAESVLNAMLMTANGAAGKTLEEMEETLTGSLGLSSYLNDFRTYNDQLSASKNVIFHSANSLWLRNDNNLLTIKDSFINVNKTYLNAEVMSEPFNSSTVGKINSWVNENTDGMINRVIDSIDEDDIMYIINALAFEGSWAEQYKSGQIETGKKFTNASGKTEDATMLRDNIYSYLSDDRALGFKRYYRGGRYAFVAIRPNDGVSVEDYLSDMTGESFLKFCQSGTSGTVITRIPKFSYDDSYELADTLKTMGIKEAFDEDNANFRNMGTSSIGNIYIGGVLHKTHIELDENGTKAAAVTAVYMKTTSCPPGGNEPVEINLDRPFIYAIVDTENYLPVFMGVVNTLK